MIRYELAGMVLFLWACGGAVTPQGDAQNDQVLDSTDESAEVDLPADHPADRQDVPVDPTPDQPPDVPVDHPTDHPADLPEGMICAPGELRCSSDVLSLEECNATGTEWLSSPCSLGCVPTPTAHCGEIDVSNVPDDSLLYAGDAWESFPVHSDATYWVDFNTGTGEINLWRADGSAWSFVAALRGEGPGLVNGIYFELVPQPEGYPTLAVFAMQDLSVPSNYIVSPTGANALVLLVENQVTIEGGVYVGCLAGGDGNYQSGARGPGEGPGAGGNGSSLVVSPEAVRDGGGGGGAFGGSGGEGGGYTADLRGAPGVPYGDPSLIPLEGGSGGGWGGGTDDGRQGGISGGAVQIDSSVGIQMSPGGWIDASGCGGLAAYSFYVSEGGGGGGSGGAILLEAPNVTMDGFLSANGGGGAAGGSYQAGTMNGENGQRTTDEPATGGVAMSEYACNGAAGSGLGITAGMIAPPCDESPDLYNAGGGGGGSGKIRINSLTSSLGGPISPPQGTEATTTGPLNLL